MSTKLMQVVHKLPESGVARTNSQHADSLRALADEIESGGWSDVDYTVTMVQRADGHLGRWVTGVPQVTKAQLVGVLTFAAHDIMEGR